MASKLVLIDAIAPSTYNPRAADPERLALVALSLSKLGFLLPIYADAEGEILSGHQRQHVARTLGCTHVPVAYTRAMALPERKAINLAFNRATNDFLQNQSSADVTLELLASDVASLAAGLPDINPLSDDMFPCLNPEVAAIEPLLKANQGRWNKYALTLATSLSRKGISMPLVVGPDDRVINGVGRLESAARSGTKAVEVIRLAERPAALAEAMLNLLSMDFDVHTRYRDLLRFNSFRRAMKTRSTLGRGFLIVAAPDQTSRDWPIEDPANAKYWKAIHGTSVVDFGAGHLHETMMLRGIGVHVAAFEPYRVGPDRSIDKAASVALTKTFLAEVASGKAYSSVFISSVLNSVPFEADRRAIVTICAALCGPSTRLYVAARSTRDPCWEGTARGGYLNDVHANTQIFALDYEPGITLGGMVSEPKVQKFHTPQELYELLKTGFQTVQVKGRGNNVEAVCAGALPVSQEALDRALEFEFDLPYPDGSRMGLADVAKDAFAARSRLVA